ncbi:50S ribosomal protein L18 [Pseudenhygromyxa sp. WMMC2535]|uniref:50S ribosomal protein L18 n=1 Tax=Pseudenhygromyxa sp. WMMC2535 TaxID=2712867 RepID=UPI001552B10F|nr:50S ribosomal protein L18 [Pseudenhygromyxa sp. WMMC2535]NVB36807.1 50S ribosomal protein L18 [Pseudenhygromyxa sp. WMMC2535]
MAKKDKTQARLRRKKSIRKSVSGTAERPRLSVYRSNKHIYAQVIDDDASKALLAVSDLVKELGGELESCESKVDRARIVGRAVAKACLDKGIEKVVFDRNGYLYHGRVSALADAAREAGLQF